MYNAEAGLIQCLFTRTLKKCSDTSIQYHAIRRDVSKVFTVALMNKQDEMTAMWSSINDGNQNKTDGKPCPVKISNERRTAYICRKLHARIILARRYKHLRALHFSEH